MMNFVEDCLEGLDKLSTIYPYNTPPGYVHPTKIISGYDLKFISDVSTHTVTGSALSTAQAALALKLIRRYLSLFHVADQVVVESLLNSPAYRRPLHETVEFPREVRWLGGSTLLFRFRYNAVISNELRSIGSEMGDAFGPSLYRDLKIWKLIVDNSNYAKVMEFIKRHNFQFDDDVLKLFMDINNSLDLPNEIRLTDDTIELDINNNVLACMWLEETEWLKNV